MSSTREHGGTSHRNLICCLLAVEIVEHETKHVFDQIRSTQDLRQLLSDATGHASSGAHASSGELVSIVREDGALLAFAADPTACFVAALAIRQATLTQDRYRGLPLRIGINLGPVEIAEDEFGHAYLSGEGRCDAERAMRHGPLDQICVARSFFEVLSRTAPELAGLLKCHGVFTDVIVPPLCLYQLDAPSDAESQSVSDRQRMAAASPVNSSAPPGLAAQTVHAQPGAKRLDRRRRSWPRYAFLPVLALGAVFALSSRFQPEPPVLIIKPVEELGAATPPAAGAAATKAPPPFPAAATAHPATRRSPTPHAVVAKSPETPATATAPPAKRRIEATPVARRIEQTGPVPYTRNSAENLQQKRTVETGALMQVESAPLPLRSATLYLAVKPWGDVYVDGRNVGVTPPLKSFEVPPGRRVITIRNGSLPVYQTELTVQPDARITVTHEFSCVSTQPSFSPPSGRASTWSLIC